MSSVLFFGSFQHYSTIIAQALDNDPDITLLGIVTTPPKPAGRNKTLQPTHTHLWAQKNKVPVFTPEKLDKLALAQISNEFSDLPDFILVAGYSKKLPSLFLNYPKIASLGLHPSLLPAYRGVRPAEFALLFDEPETGISLILLNQDFDTGPILAQEKLAIAPQDNRQTLYQNLYQLEAKVAIDSIKNWETVHKNTITQPPTSPTPYARKLTKDEGFIDWPTLVEATSGEPITTPIPLLKDLNLPTTVESIERFYLALYGYPGIWTEIPTASPTPIGTYPTKRMKVLRLHLEHQKGHRPQLILDQVQLEGKQPSTFNQIKNQISA